MGIYNPIGPNWLIWTWRICGSHKTVNVTINLLETKFAKFVISGYESVGWTPRSGDLTPLDYFLCGYVNSMVYANKSVMNIIRITNVELQKYRQLYTRKSSKIGLSVWTSAACPLWPCKINRVSFILASNVLLQE